jgi:hypothetical protein
MSEGGDMNELKIAACGLDCNACDLYNAGRDIKAAESLVPWFRSQGWIDEGGGAEAVQGKAPFCEGCRNKAGVRWSGDCELLACCEAKRVGHCGECADFPCAKYKEWAADAPHHKKAMERLLS